MATEDDLKAAIDALEAVVRDRTLLLGLSVEERTRLLAAAGDVFNPDLVRRRQWAKELRRQGKAEKRQRDDAALAETGIRVLRAKPVFTTPNVFPPDEPETNGAGEVLDEQHCYVCKTRFSELHHFYDQMCGPCGDFNFAKRTETADLSGRVALLTGGRSGRRC